MTSARLENLVSTGDLEREAPGESELKGLMASGVSRLEDARRDELAQESRFDLAYNAAYSLARYALRRKGYRPKRRYLVFQLLEETAGLARSRWRVLDKAHWQRNRIEYEGFPEVDQQLLADMLEVTAELLDALERDTAMDADG